MPYLSVIIPAYNEAARLPDTLRKVCAYLDAQTYESEVLVVDDGSKDETVRLAQEIAATFPIVKVITNKHNKGKGGVVRQGMLEATGDWRLFTDADNSTPIEQVVKLLSEVPKYEVVIGSRYLEPGSIKIKQPFKRLVISRVSNLAIQMLLLPGIIDTQCGFKLFSAAAAERIFPHQSMKSWSFDIEILVIARKLGYTIKQVPVDWFDATRSTFSASRGAGRFLRDLITIRTRVASKQFNEQTNG